MGLVLKFLLCIVLLVIVLVDGVQLAKTKGAVTTAQVEPDPELTSTPSSSESSLEPTSSMPSHSPSLAPSHSSPTKSPSTPEPSKAPSRSPISSAPSKTPISSAPTRSPSDSPTTSHPSRAPTSSSPTRSPSRTPSTSKPSRAPTTSSPTKSPSKSPSTSEPSKTPTTSSPSASPSSSPSTSRPSRNPTTSSPTHSPSKSPTTSQPSTSPSKSPTTSRPSRTPSLSPTTSRPSKSPSNSPTTSRPSRSPSKTPTTSHPTQSPSKSPTTSRPSKSPTKSPTTSKPSQSPTKSPTTSLPTKSPTSRPSQNPTESPTERFRQPNILLFLADDFKPVLEAYKSPFVPAGATPNLDRLAKNGVSFMNAHVQMAICGPSRASFLTSMRPDVLKIYGLETNCLQARIATSIRQKKEILTLPKLFKLAGYVTYGVGKVFHENEYTLMARADTWTVPMYSWVTQMKRPPSFTKPYQGSWINAPDVNDTYFSDAQAAHLAANLIRDVLAHPTAEAPWFLAVGFWKPHLPWSAPKKYYDMCAPFSTFNAAYANLPTVGLGVANMRLARGDGCIETREYNGPWKLNSGTANADAMRQANRAYHATAFYMDAQLGVVLQALDASKDKDNTIIVFLGDHGFHLGDKGLYCKKTNYEQSTKVPLIMNMPTRWGTKHYPRNRQSFAPVELIDLVPTLFDLAALNINLNAYTRWQGLSLSPILIDPENGFVKQAAVSQYPRGKGSKKLMGYAVRTTRYRFVKWGNSFEELYDYLADPQETRSFQAANKPLRAQLMASAFNNKNWAANNGKVPFDFSQRNAMQQAPPQANA